MPCHTHTSLVHAPCLADSSCSLISLSLFLGLSALSETDEAQNRKDRRAEKAEDARRCEPLIAQDVAIHKPKIAGGDQEGIGGTIWPLVSGSTRSVLLHYGLPERVADVPETWTVWHVGNARTACLGILMFTFYAQRRYDVGGCEERGEMSILEVGKHDGEQIGLGNGLDVIGVGCCVMEESWIIKVYCYFFYLGESVNPSAWLV